ncbi:hypothetical protein MYX06_00715 [Patescibacteria group bacterium AH-259-L05]|nr:hypothetical protein [Patescibacteria group bacterium AH-259-L05]
MIISLIGMSGSGKTYWSQKLADQRFYNICCDDLIEEKLAPELNKLGYSGISDVAQWLGQPYDAQFRRNQSMYLEHEKQVTHEILSKIKKEDIGNVVIDTTGSVIYMGRHIMKQLKKYTTVVYLKIPFSLQEEMFKLYFNDPKPVIWKNSFKKKKNETNEQSLRRYYPKLVQYRVQLYEKYADATIDYRMLRSDSFTVHDFLKTIKVQL